MVHVALVRVVVGAVATWRFYSNGVLYGTGTSSVVDFDATGNRWTIGASYNHQYPYGLPGTVKIDDIRVTKNALYTGASLTVPTVPFSTTSPASDRTFSGQMDEFAVYNKRCIHDTSDTFQKPVLPIRDTAVTIAAAMDSEGGHGQVVTTRNAGHVIPNSQQGLPGASLYNEDGFVKIRPA
jgi:hypothetical protein